MDFYLSLIPFYLFIMFYYLHGFDYPSDQFPSRSLLSGFSLTKSLVTTKLFRPSFYPISEQNILIDLMCPISPPLEPSLGAHGEL